MQVVHKRAIAFAERARSVIVCAAVLATASNPFCAAAASAATSIPVMPAVPAPRVITQLTTPRGETVTFRISTDGSVSVDGTFPASAFNYSTQANHQQYATPLDLFHAVAPNLQPPLVLREANARYISFLQHRRALRSTPTQAGQAPSFSHVRQPMDATDDWFVSNFCQNSPAICATNAYGWAYCFNQSVYQGYAVALAKTAPLTFAVNGVGSWSVPQGYYRWAQKYTSSWEAEFGFGSFTWDAAVSNAQFFDFESYVYPA